MPNFTYKAKKGPAEIIKGELEAESLDLAVRKVSDLGLVPIDVSLAANAAEKTVTKQKTVSFARRKKVKLGELVVFTRQMSDLLDAAVPLLRAVQIAKEQTESPVLEAIIEEMAQFIKNGGSLSDSLAQYREVFPPLYINMVRAGEVGGQLNIILNRLADYLEKEQETRAKITSSLAYPMLILVVGILTVFVLLTFIIPRLMVIFEDMDQAMPLPTVILLNISSFLANYWWLIVLIIAVAAYFISNFLRTDRGRISFDRFKMRLPLFGRYIRIIEVSRFSRTLATLVESGVHITSALNSVWSTVENKILQDEIKEVSQKVTSGASIKNALRDCTFFPSMAVNMISVGEETGHLEKGLYKIANVYDRQSDQMAKTILSLLGPLVLVFIVLIVGAVVISILLPIFQMNTLIQ